MSNVIDLFAEFAVDEKKAVEGALVPYRDGLSFLIARHNNRVYRKTAHALYKRHKRILDAEDDASAAKLTEVLIEGMAEGILLGWEGEVKFRGEALLYSKENAKKLLSMERFRDWVDAQSKDEDKFKVAEEEVQEKN